MEGAFPQVAFEVFGIPVRDTVISTWIVMAIILAVVLVLKKRFPRGLDLLIEYLHDTLSDVMGRPAWPYLPFLGSLAIFVATANVSSILPAIPLPGGGMLPIVSPTRDINTPVALAIVVFLAVHVYGMRSRGVLNYLKALASPIYLAPLTFTLEIFGQVSRSVSLAIRLFGNIISTELVVAVVSSLLPLIVPLPLIGLSMFTGLLQAYIFTVLATIFIAGGLEEHESDKEPSDQPTDS
jgi:F-type H+-transporting ATPase subunit a